ncbi:MAG TPA: hypothetical protein VER55_14750, partial [Ardenticatenaceae bacterium]|nr:hypothetical protein [Ardenticatenaceae bacterium]
TMRAIPPSDLQDEPQDDLLPEYRFDYSKARPNQFAPLLPDDRLMVVLDPDITHVFSTSEAVNEALRTLITTSSDTAQ